MKKVTPSRLPTYFLSHGGGPWPYMTGEYRQRFSKLEQSLIDMRTEIAAIPKAVLVISGHWEEQGLMISSGANPAMVYDYNGFPEFLYQIKYGAPGSPELAKQVQSLMQDQGIDLRLDPTRGYDHGTFSIMKVLYPDEDTPIVQLSLNSNYDPAFHLKVGRALAPLRDQGVLIIGSGLSYHNMRDYLGGGGSESSRQFDEWLQETLIRSPPSERVKRLIDWEQAPSARAAHPREDHLIPLMVAVGAAGDDPGAVTYHEAGFGGGLTTSSFRFGKMPTTA